MYSDYSVSLNTDNTLHPVLPCFVCLFATVLKLGLSLIRHMLKSQCCVSSVLYSGFFFVLMLRDQDVNVNNRFILPFPDSNCKYDCKPFVQLLMGNDSSQCLQ